MRIRFRPRNNILDPPSKKCDDDDENYSHLPRDVFAKTLLLFFSIKSSALRLSRQKQQHKFDLTSLEATVGSPRKLTPLTFDCFTSPSVI